MQLKGLSTMTDSENGNPADPYAPVEVDLKNRWLAALWAWLWPGAGHLYQGRHAKGILCMVCILVTYFWGLALGGGHVVYASFKKPDVRYPFLCQIGVGLPAFPALVQRFRQNEGKELLFGGLMGPPEQPVREQDYDELARWHSETGFYFELGTLYTMIAGLLNFLAIYDAHSGPVFTAPDSKRDRTPSDSQDTSD
jgi:TM2 domain-containing membrane protein YozV